MAFRNGFLNRSDPVAMRRLREKAEEEKRERKKPTTTQKNATPTQNRVMGRIPSARASEILSDSAALNRLRERAARERSEKNKSHGRENLYCFFCP